MRSAAGKYAYLALGWLCLLVVTLPVYFVVKAGFSDVLYFESLATDLFKNGGRWSGWSLSAAPVFFPDMLVTFVNYFLFTYTSDKLFILTLFDIVCIVWATEYFFRSISRPIPPNLSFILLLLMALISYCVVNTGMFLYAHSSNAHIGTWILFFFCLGLALRFLVNGQRRYIYGLAALAAFGVINDNLFLVSFTAPALATCLFIYILLRICDRQHPLLRRLRILILVLPLSYAAAFALQPILLPYEQLSSRVPITMAGIILTSKLFVDASIELILGRNPVFGFFFLLWFAGMAAALSYGLKATARLLRGQRPDFLLYFAAIFTPIAVLCNVGGVILSGVAQDLTMYRYFETAMVMPVAMLFPLVHHFYRAQAQSRILTGICIVLALVVTGFYLIHFKAMKPRQFTVNEVRRHAGLPEKKLAECLDNNKEKYGLQYGLADFWSAATTNLMSEKGLRVALVNGPWHTASGYYFNTRGWNLDQRHYLSNIDWDLGAPGTAYTNPFYNFIIVNAGFTEENILRQSTAGMKPVSFSCPPEAYIFGIPTTILVYDRDSGFNELVYRKAAAAHQAYAFESGKINSITYPGDVLPTDIGFIHENAMHAARGHTQPGILTFGPFIKLSRGQYRATIAYTMPDAAGSSSGSWDVFTKWKVFTKGELPAVAGEGKITADFTISSREDERKHLEVRSFYNGSGNIFIRSVTIERVK